MKNILLTYVLMATSAAFASENSFITEAAATVPPRSLTFQEYQKHFPHPVTNAPEAFKKLVSHYSHEIGEGRQPNEILDTLPEELSESFSQMVIDARTFKETPAKEGEQSFLELHDLRSGDKKMLEFSEIIFRKAQEETSEAQLKTTIRFNPFDMMGSYQRFEETIKVTSAPQETTALNSSTKPAPNHAPIHTLAVHIKNNETPEFWEKRTYKSINQVIK